MCLEAIKIFLINTIEGHGVDEEFLNNKLDSFTLPTSDINFIESNSIEITLYGELTNKVNILNKDVVMVYRYKERFDGNENIYFGFLYNDNGAYLEYYVNFHYCFKDKITNKTPFNYTHLIPPQIDLITAFDKHINVKKIIGEDSYNLIVDFMLTDNNLKVKNAIYKIF